MVEYTINKIATGEINVLPASINFTGVIASGKTTWEKAAETETVNDATVKVNYLRGRKLIGTENKLNGKVLLFEKEINPSGEENYKSVAQTDRITTFDHQFRGSEENNQIERINEWHDITRVINE